MSAAKAAKAPQSSKAPPKKKGLAERMLDGVERVGNKIPHPVMMFLYLILFVIVLSHILYAHELSVTQEIAVPVTVDAVPYWSDSSAASMAVAPDEYTEPDYEIKMETVTVRSLLTVEGIRFIFTSFVANFAGFSVVAVVLVAMLGVGVAEESGLMGALIRKLVEVAPRRIITFSIVLLGVISSIATDAGYLILIPLAAVAFVRLKRHPLAGIAAAFAGVGAVFAVNILITPLDSMLTEVTNEAIRLVNPNAALLSVTSNLYFGIVSTLILAVIVTVISERMIEPRLGAYDPSEAPVGVSSGEQTELALSPAAEARGLKYALYAFLVVGAIIALLTLIPGAPLSRGEPGSGASPFLDSIILIITLLFLAAGIGFGRGADTLKGSNAVIAAVTKTFAGLSSLIFLLLIISQFLAHFNYTRIPQVLAIGLADLLERGNVGAVPLLIGLVIVIFLLDFIIPNSVPKWAIFAPVFVPLFMQLGMPPQTVLAAYRIGDAPANVITPLMVYFPFIVLVAQKYQKDAGIGSVIAVMLPYAFILLVAWIILLVAWFLLGIPLGPGYGVGM